MGAGQSTAGTNASSSTPKRGLHVLRVTSGSPAANTNIEPFFDFIVGIEGAPVQQAIDPSQLENIVESHEGRTLNLLVWNSQTQDTRVVPLVPSRNWSQERAQTDPKEPDANAKPSLLGLSMRLCDPEPSLDNVWHVMDVFEGSPAESAGLVPYGDWVIGWSGGVLSAEGDFYDVVEAHIDKPLRVYVYSHDFHTIREVVLIPNRNWGGEGLLGCVFGFGLLHRIPPPASHLKSGDLPPDLLEEDEEDEDLFVPADMTINGYQNGHAHEADSLGYGRENGYDLRDAANGTNHSSSQGQSSRSSTPVQVSASFGSPIRVPTPTRSYGFTGTAGLGAFGSPPSRGLLSGPLGTRSVSVGTGPKRVDAGSDDENADGMSSIGEETEGSLTSVE